MEDRQLRSRVKQQVLPKRQTSAAALSRLVLIKFLPESSAGLRSTAMTKSGILFGEPCWQALSLSAKSPNSHPEPRPAGCNLVLNSASSGRGPACSLQGTLHMALRTRLRAELLRHQLQEQLQNALGCARLPGVQGPAGLSAAAAAASGTAPPTGHAALHSLHSLEGRLCEARDSRSGSARTLAQLIEFLQHMAAEPWAQQRRWYVHSSSTSSAAALPDSLAGAEAEAARPRSSKGASSSRGRRRGPSMPCSANGSSDSSSGGIGSVGGSGGSSNSRALSELLLGRRRALPGLEGDESALSLPEVPPLDKALLDLAGGERLPGPVWQVPATSALVLCARLCPGRKPGSQQASPLGCSLCR